MANKKALVPVERNESRNCCLCNKKMTEDQETSFGVYKVERNQSLIGRFHTGCKL